MNEWRGFAGGVETGASLVGAAAAQNRQIVAGQKYSPNDASSYNFSRETRFYVKSLIF